MHVGDVAAAAGLSVRTLHHWDAVGLLVPSGRTPSGYRSYDAADVERLQKVLTYRELGFGLTEVKRLLDDPDVDALEHLCRQQSLLADRIARLQAVAALVHRAVEAQMSSEDLRAVFGQDDPTRYEAEVLQRWGDSEPYRQSTARTARYTRDDWAAVKAQGEAVEQRFAALLVAGVAADDARAAEVAEEHRAWVGCFYDVSYELHVGLADTYVSDERFTAHYEAVAPGLAAYVADAVRANAAGR